jgi:hypothetical protein
VPLVPGWACAALLAAGAAPAAAERPPEKMGDIPSQQYLAVPVRVTDKMLMSSTDVVCGYILDRKATVQVSVYDGDRKLLLAEEQREAPAKELVRTRPWWWSQAKKAGAHYVVFRATGEGASRKAFRHVAVTYGGRRFGTCDLQPAAGKRGDTIRVQYRLLATSKVLCDYVNADDLNKAPTPISDQGNRAGNTDYTVEWKADVDEGTYLIQLSASPLQGEGPPDVQAWQLTIGK